MLFLIAEVVVELQSQSETGKPHATGRNSCSGEGVVIGHNRDGTGLERTNWQLQLAMGLQAIPFE